MVRTALAQIFYKPAIVERLVDHLAEPGLVQGNVSTTSLLETLSPSRCSELQNLQARIREEYITYITQKLKEVSKQAYQIHQPDILVFPEYAVPYPCLPVLRELAVQLGMTIVAGSHTVLAAAAPYYTQAGLDLKIIDYCGTSISPIFFPDGKADYQVKHDRSIFEVTMRESTEPFKRFCSITRGGESYSFYVVICADALSIETVGKLTLTRTEEADENLMVLTVACSTNTAGFQALSDLLALKQVPFLVCNTSRYGGSGIYLTHSVRKRFVNPPGQSSWLESGVEALFLLDFLPKSYFVKRGVLDTDVRGCWSVCPILYAREVPWKRDYLKTIHQIETHLREGALEEAEETAELLIMYYEGQLPPSLEAAFRHFMEQLSNFTGDISVYILPLYAVLLTIHSTQAHLRHELPDAIEFCVQVGAPAFCQLKELITQRDTYPEEELAPLRPTLPDVVVRVQPIERENLEFRDRGSYMDQLQDAITDPAVRLILVSGAYGIGKTSLVSITFKRNLPNWQVKFISLTPNTRFSMVLEYMANAIGNSLRADTLNRSTKAVLRPTMDRFAKDLLAKDGRVVVVDQMESILMEQQGKDFTQLTLFRNAVYGLKTGQGKLIFLSDVRFSKQFFPDNPAVRRIVVGRIPDDRYIKHILEYEMRKHDMISPGSVPELPDALYELVNGHPLTAKLCVDVMARRGWDSLGDIALGQMQDLVIRQLLEKICLNHVETQLMRILSVFRTLIQVPRLERCLPPQWKDLLHDNLDTLYKTPFISAGEETLELTAVFRSYYYEQIPPEERESFHQCALTYYVELHRELAGNHQFSAQIYAEIAYHLTKLGRMKELADYLPGNVTTLKQLAKTLYQRERNYTAALQLYRMLNEAYQQDVEVLSYLGRCYARTDKWDLTESYFQKAILCATDQREDTWYLYRDLGHLYVRYGNEEKAQYNFALAREYLTRQTGQTDDAGILAAEGFMLERNHDFSGAAEKYEAALALNESHEFTIRNYANLLRRQGNMQQADALEQQLIVSRYENLGEPTDGFYSGFDIVDADQEVCED